MKIQMTCLMAALMMINPTALAATYPSPCAKAYGGLRGEMDIAEFSGELLENFAGATALTVGGFETVFRLRKMEKLIKRPYGIPLVGGVLVILFAAGFNVVHKARVRQLYAEVVGHAIVESEQGVVGPATLTLVEFVRALITQTAVTDRGQIFAKFTLPEDFRASLVEVYGNAVPSAEKVQTALRWMNKTTLLCHADATALTRREFAERFGYALKLVAATP